jgi:predicted metal-dependent peptidase
VVYGDTSVRHTQHFETEDLPIKLEIHGGGGTKFVPALQYIRDHYPNVDAILFFTDMGAWDWDEVPQYNPGKPVLWMNTNRYSDGMDVPFGTVVPLEVDYEKYG